MDSFIFPFMHFASRFISLISPFRCLHFVFVVDPCWYLLFFGLSLFSKCHLCLFVSYLFLILSLSKKITSDWICYSQVDRRSIETVNRFLRIYITTFYFIFRHCPEHTHYRRNKKARNMKHMLQVAI